MNGEQRQTYERAVRGILDLQETLEGDAGNLNMSGLPKKELSRFVHDASMAISQLACAVQSAGDELASAEDSRPG